MNKLQPEQRSMPEINPEKVCFIVEKSRELFSAAEGATDFVSDSEEDGLDALTEDPTEAMRDELAEFIGDLDVDEQCALVALMWIGRGDFEPEHWEAAIELAAQRREASVADYLIGNPQLPDHLEEALADYGCSCRDYGAEP